MTERRFSAEEVERGKELAAGPLGQELTRFSLRFAQPILIANSPRPGVQAELNNGTATLVDFGEGPLAITCSHVVEAYRTRKELNPEVQFQIGNLKVDPLAQLIDEDSDLDIATISLAGLNVSRMSVRDDGIPEFHQPARWPPMAINEGDAVTLAGYPGAWRQPPAGPLVEFDTLSIGVTDVSAVDAGRFICQFEREFWVRSFGFAGQDLRQLGGMSGGPAFVIRQLHWEFVGIIYQFSEDFDLLYVRRADLIGSDGRIARMHI